MRRTRQRGFSVVEALVGAMLAGLAIAGLAAVASLATRSLCLARDGAVALALAGERLETLRAGGGTNGADSTTAAGGTVFSRRWQLTGGRGGPLHLSVRVAWPTHVQDLATEVPP